MTYMGSWKNLTSHTWLGLNPQIGRPLSRIVVPLVYFITKRLIFFQNLQINEFKPPKELELVVFGRSSIKYIKQVSEPILQLIRVLIWIF
jgi:hypothetical protein